MLESAHKSKTGSSIALMHNFLNDSLFVRFISNQVNCTGHTTEHLATVH